MRRRIGTRERVDIFQRNGGTCHLCGLKVQPGQEWDVSHETPLELGGADEGDNLKVAHRRCHRMHTATVDVPIIRRAQRKEANHIGARVSRNPLPFGRKSRLKRKLNGQVVER